MSESEIAELCRRIYRKHQQALDLVFDHRPDQQSTLREFLETLIKARPELVLDSSAKQHIRFASMNWETPRLKSGQGWTPSGRMLLFEFQNFQDSLNLKLIIGPGPQDIRQKLLEIALAKQPPFKPLAKFLNEKYNQIFAHGFLSAKSYADTNDEELENKIRDHWEHFIQNDLPGVINSIGSAD